MKLITLLAASLFAVPVWGVDKVVDHTLEISFETPTTRVNGDPLSYQEIKEFLFSCEDDSNNVVTTTLETNDAGVGYYNLLTENVLPEKNREYSCTLVVVATDSLKSQPSNVIVVEWREDAIVEDATPQAPTGFGTEY